MIDVHTYAHAHTYLHTFSHAVLTSHLSPLTSHLLLISVDAMEAAAKAEADADAAEKKSKVRYGCFGCCFCTC
jgi:hypothetical protein